MSKDIPPKTLEKHQQQNLKSGQQEPSGSKKWEDKRSTSAAYWGSPPNHRLGDQEQIRRDFPFPVLIKKQSLFFTAPQVSCHTLQKQFFRHSPVCQRTVCECGHSNCRMSRKKLPWVMCLQLLTLRYTPAKHTPVSNPRGQPEQLKSQLYSSLLTHIRAKEQCMDKGCCKDGQALGNFCEMG